MVSSPRALRHQVDHEWQDESLKGEEFGPILVVHGEYPTMHLEGDGISLAEAKRLLEYLPQAIDAIERRKR